MDQLTTTWQPTATESTFLITRITKHGGPADRGNYGFAVNLWNDFRAFFSLSTDSAYPPQAVSHKRITSIKAAGVSAW
jgi:hypothetical protein